MGALLDCNFYYSSMKGLKLSLHQCKARGVAAVTTSSKKERIQAYAELDSLPDLKPEEVEQIDKAGQGSHYRYYNQHVSPTATTPLTDATSYWSLTTRAISLPQMVKELPVPEGVNHLEGPVRLFLHNPSTFAHPTKKRANFALVFFTDAVLDD